MRVYNPDREERAFLYQEAQAIEPLVKDLGSLSVLVENSRSKFRVTFLVAPESFAMRVQATGENLFEVVVAAKDETVRQLNALVNQTDSQGRPPSELLH